ITVASRMQFAAAGAMWLVGLVAAGFGGAAFAHERADRSADFLAMLPVTRRQILVSKLTICIGALLMMWLGNFAVVLWTHSLQSDRWHWATEYQAGIFASIIPDAAATIMFFSIAWLASAFLQSPTKAALVSIVFTVSATYTSALLVVSSSLGSQGQYAVALTISILGVVLSLVALIGGSLYYVRRIEP